MLSVDELRSISGTRLEDAQTLFTAGRYDGVVYLCGYAVELALKARICETLNWDGYPSTNREFWDYQSFRTHDLKVSATAQRAGKQNHGRYAQYLAGSRFMGS